MSLMQIAEGTQSNCNLLLVRLNVGKLLS